MALVIILLVKPWYNPYDKLAYLTLSDGKSSERTRILQ